jgi:hypothetical protein
MTYRQPIIVLSLLLFLIAVALAGFLMHQRNQTKVPFVTAVTRPTQPVVNPTPSDPVVDPVDSGEDGLGIEDPVVELVEPTQPAPVLERVFSGQKEYKVVAGDTVSTITLRQWGNVVLWPDLYTSNKWIHNDPDLILPGELVMIFDKLGNNATQFSEQDKQYLLEAYIKVYKMYRDLGEKRNASKWYTLGLALRVEPTFFELYANEIDERDIQMVRSLNQQAAAFR